jgi:SAV_6107-like HEPN
MPDPLRPRRAGPAAVDLLEQARHGLVEASTLARATERYATAHLAALRTAAAVLAARTHPEQPRTTRRRSGPRNAWELLAEVAPELSEWAAFFAAGAGKRAAAESGATSAVTDREADDLLRDVETFLALAATTLGVPDQPVLSGALTRQAG